MKKRRTTKTIMKLRIESRREQLVRLMFLGWSTARCAKAVTLGGQIKPTKTESARTIGLPVPLAEALDVRRGGWLAGS